MKKSVLFLFFFLAIMAGCDKAGETLLNGNSSQKSNKLRWYGVKLPDESFTRGVAEGTKRWNQDAGIYVKFINTPSDAQTIDRVKEIAIEWEEYAGIKFHFVESSQNAHVRIAFDWNGNDWLTWSYTGTDAKFIRNQNEPTAAFGGLEYLDDEEFKGDVLRLFGQILGLEYEQRHQQWAENGYWKNESYIQSYWEDQFEGYDMDWEEIREYVFDPLTGQNTYQLLQTPDIDELSIMAWPYYARKQTTNLIANYELSEGDKAFIASLYPLPTIQQAWVNPGYFEWTDDSKTHLKITPLGRMQKSLPNVCDGEQLTSAEYMFAPDPPVARLLLTKHDGKITRVTDFSMESSCKLKKAPQLNTSNITSFRGMFQDCYDLETIPEYDTSNGEDFYSMFLNCNSLETLPKLNTSNGIDFEHMFNYCYSLTSVPYLNTSNGMFFSSMFFGCSALLSIPELNTSNGIYFTTMFCECSSLIVVPELNTSNGIHFSHMFNSCITLTNIPAFNTSNGMYFDNMFSNCSSLTNIPDLNTSNGINFSRIFMNCTSLTGIPLLNTSNGTEFSYMFLNCSSLISIPELNTSNGTNFRSMFENCIALSDRPQLDLSKATDIRDMYKGTPWQ